MECDLRFVSSGSVLEPGTARQGRLSSEEAAKACINTQLVRRELEVSLDQEHGTRKTTSRLHRPHTLWQIGHTVMSVIIKKRICL